MGGLKTSEKVMKLSFGLYLTLYICEKLCFGFRHNSPVLGNLKALTQFAIAFIFTFVMYELGPDISVQDRTFASNFLIFIPVVVYFLQEYTDTILNSGSLQDNENAKNWMNSMYIAVLFSLCMGLNWFFYDPTKNFTSFIITGLGIALYLFYTLYSNLSANASNTMKGFELSKTALNFPKTLTFFSVALYFTVMCMKNTFSAVKPEKFKTKLYACAFAIPLIAGSFQMGSFVSDSIWALKRLMATKLINILNLIDGSWTYHDICSQKINDIITNVISVRSSVSTPSRNDIEAWLTIDDPKDLNSFGLTDTIPLNIFRELQAYIQARNSNSDLEQFLGKFYRNTDPLKSDKLVYNNTGIWSCFTLGTLTIVYLGSSIWTKKLKVLTLYSGLGVVLLVGFLVYLGYTLRTVSLASAARHEVYCEQYNLKGNDCETSDSQYQQANFKLINQINAIKNGSGPIIIDGVTVYDVAENKNMKQLYNALKTYPGQSALPDYIDTMLSAFNTLKSVAIEVSLQARSDASSIKIYSASSDPVSTKLDLTDISLQDLMDVLVDSRNFMQSLGASMYVPDQTRTFNMDNAYFSISQAPNGNEKQVMIINYAGKGQSFRQNIMDLFRVKGVVEEMIFDFSVLGNNLNITMNPSLLRNLYNSDQLNINANSHPYADAIKYSLKAILTKKLTLDIKIETNPRFDLASYKFDQLTSPRSNWTSLKSFKTTNEYDIISNLPFMSTNDAITVKDLLMHAISPVADSRYDSTVGAYLEDLLWVVKLEMLNDSSAIMEEVKYTENTVFKNLNLCTAVFIIIFIFYIFSSLDIGFSSDSYFSDYFQSSALGSKSSHVYNSLILLVTLISLAHSVSIFTDLYRLEKASFANVAVTDPSIWGGKKTTVPLIVSICILLMFTPMYFPRIDNREHVYLVTFLLICTMCSPIIYASNNNKEDTILTARKLNGIAVISVFAAVSLLLITRDSAWLKNSFWSKGGIYLVLGAVCLTCVSTPMMFLDIYHPEISTSEFEDRVKTVNVGVYIAISIYVLLYLLYFVKMKRRKLFANPIPRL